MYTFFPLKQSYPSYESLARPHWRQTWTLGAHASSGAARSGTYRSILATEYSHSPKMTSIFFGRIRHVSVALAGGGVAPTVEPI